MIQVCPSPTVFLSIMESHSYRVFHRMRKGLNLNIVGWRSRDPTPNEFDDLIAVYWEKEIGVFDHKFWRATTLPGTPWLLNPMNPDGAAIVVPGQYLDAYKLGVYHNYKALKQYRPMKVYRDRNFNGVPDTKGSIIEEGLFGIHIHKAGFFSKLVGTSSAGCQVFQSAADFEDFIALCELDEKSLGNVFSYTLLDEP